MRMPFSSSLCLAAAASAVAGRDRLDHPGTEGDRFRRYRHQCRYLYRGSPTSAPRRAPACHRRPAPSAPRSDGHLVSGTPDVAGKVGTQFGIEYPIDGAPAGDGVTLHLVLAFWPQGIRNPNTGDMMHAANMAPPNMKIGAICLLGYGFDNAWEIVPGLDRTDLVSGPHAGRADLYGKQTGITKPAGSQSVIRKSESRFSEEDASLNQKC